MKNVFIIGCARSGTSIVGELIASHPQVKYIFEAAHIWELGGMGRNESHRLTAQHATESVKHQVREWFEHQARGTNILVEKSPRNSLRIPYVHKIFPEAKFIHIVRDGRDVACSMVPGCGGTQWNHLKPPSWQEYFKKYSGAVRCAYAWKQTLEIALQDLVSVPHIQVRYEDLLQSPSQTAKVLFDFLGLDLHPNTLEFCGKITNQTSSSYHAQFQDQWYREDHAVRVGRWRENLSTQEAEMIDALLKPLLTRFGYVSEPETPKVDISNLRDLQEKPKELGNRLIVVLGMHRSGTSAITRGLQVMGVELGDTLLPPDADNITGFWEDVDINALNSEMLNVLDTDWHFLQPIPPTAVETLCANGYLERAVKLLEEKTSGLQVFGFKDPRLAKLLPFWKKVFASTQFLVSYVITIRHPLSVARSLASRDHLDSEKSHLLWLEHVLNSLVHTEAENCIVVDYDRFIQAPEYELTRVAKALELRIDLPELERFKTGFLDQGLRHTVYQLDDLALDEAVPPLVREVYEEMMNAATDKTGLQDAAFREKIVRWHNEFSRQRSALALADKLMLKAYQAGLEREQAAQAYAAEREQAAQAYLEGEIRKFTSSTIWRVAQLLLRILEVIAPHGSWRDRAFRKFIRSLKALRQKIVRGGLNEVTADAGSLLRYEIESEIPQKLIAGQGNYVYVSGWCFHPEDRISKLSLSLDGKEYPVPNFAYARPDVLQHFHNPYGLNSGFWGLLPIMPVSTPQDIEITLSAHFVNHPKVSIPVGQIHVLPAAEAEKANFIETSTDEPLVAICMPTFNPTLDLFAQQVNSLRNQTHTNWFCIVNDDCSNYEIYEQIVQILDSDPRFIIYRNEIRLGQTYNLEKALERVPEAADYIILSDPSDSWLPEMLTTSLQAFRSDQEQLVYSGREIVMSDGSSVMQPQESHLPKYRSLETLLFSNEVTETAPLFRAALLQDILPFPARLKDGQHGYWVACVALTKGRIQYVDRPLYTSIQSSNTSDGPRNYTLLPETTQLPGWLRSYSTFRNEMAAILFGLEAAYLDSLTRLVMFAKILVLRIPEMARSKQASLRSIASAERNSRGLAWQAVKYLVSRRPSAGHELFTLRSYFGHSLFSTYYRYRGASLLKKSPSAADSASHGPSAGTPPSSIVEESVNLLRMGTAPVPLAVKRDEPERVNIFMATINFKYIFGGYIAMLTLARNIALNGRRARIVLIEPTDYKPEEWKKLILGYPGLEDLFEHVEFSYNYDRSIPLPVNPADVFVATSCWTAHIAWHSAQKLGERKIIFLAQEYEPIFFNAGSFQAISRSAYYLPQYTIFSTELLREYFKINRIGVYAESPHYGDEHSLVFHNAINSFHVSLRGLQARKRKRFLFYARPEQHAARNLFELGILGLSEAVRSGCFDTQEWDFYGIGTSGNMHKIRLDKDVFLTLLPKVNLKEYKEILPTYDLGMSLMLSPHPSLVPLEMAAAGMITVTNTCENKTADKLTAISTNLIGVPPTIEGIKMGLAQGVHSVDDHEARITGADVHWPTTWEQAFDSEFIRKLNKFLSLANRR